MHRPFRLGQGIRNACTKDTIFTVDGRDGNKTGGLMSTELIGSGRFDQSPPETLLGYNTHSSRYILFVSINNTRRKPYD